MKQENRQRSGRTHLYLSPEYPCAYLPGRVARTLFVDPAAPLNPLLYSTLLGLGFRRSGDHVYRPECASCQACVPVRIPVDDFQPRRNQRRCWLRNAPHIRVRARPAAFHAEHFQLYQRYTGIRHPDGGMADVDAGRYLDFLITHWGHTYFYEFLRDGELMAVAVTDRVLHGLSAVYTFFDPRLASFSPGMFCLLWQIEETRRQGLRWLYLGYWIKDCEKMRYKDQYRPIEAWNGHAWQGFQVGQPISFEPPVSHPEAPRTPRGLLPVEDVSLRSPPFSR